MTSTVFASYIRVLVQSVGRGRELLQAGVGVVVIVTRPPRDLIYS